MNPVVEKRRATIINIVYFAVILALFYFAFDLFFPLILPFLFAFFIASILNKPIKAINKKIPVKRNILSVIFVLLILGALSAVFFFIGMEVFEKLKGFFDYVILTFRNISGLFNDIKLWILDITAFLPEALRTVLHENVTLFFDNIIENGFSNISIDAGAIDWSSVLTTGGQFLSGTVGQIPSLIISFVIMVISTVFITNDYDRIVRFIVRQFPERTADKLVSGWRLGISTLRKMAKAYCLIILFTTFELTVGFYILKFAGVFQSPYVIILAFIIALIDIIPVLGTGTVLIPWGVYSLITGNIGLGIGLLVIYAVILVVRQVIEPKLVAGQVGLPPIVTIVAMYIGTKTLGVLGFFILPFIVILIKVLNDEGIINILKKEEKTVICSDENADAEEIEKDADIREGENSAGVTADSGGEKKQSPLQ